MERLAGPLGEPQQRRRPVRQRVAGVANAPAPTAPAPKPPCVGRPTADRRRAVTDAVGREAAGVDTAGRQPCDSKKPVTRAVASDARRNATPSQVARSPRGRAEPERLDRPRRSGREAEGSRRCPEGPGCVVSGEAHTYRGQLPAANRRSRSGRHNVSPELTVAAKSGRICVGEDQGHQDEDVEQAPKSAQRQDAVAEKLPTPRRAAETRRTRAMATRHAHRCCPAALRACC